MTLPTLWRHSLPRIGRREAVTCQGHHEPATGSPGASAAGRCMRSSGLITRCVVPSGHSVLSFNSTWPAAFSGTFVGKRRPGDAAAQLLQPLAVMRLDPHRGVLRCCRRWKLEPVPRRNQSSPSSA